MGFLQSLWRGFVDFLKALGNGLIALFKLIVVVASGIVECIASIYAGIFNLIKSGAKKIYLMMLKKPETNQDEVSAEFLTSVTDVIDTASKNGKIKELPVDWEKFTIVSIAANQDNTISSASDVKVLDMKQSQHITQNKQILRTLDREGIACLT